MVEISVIISEIFGEVRDLFLVHHTFHVAVRTWVVVLIRSHLVEPTPFLYLRLSCNGILYNQYSDSPRLVV